MKGALHRWAGPLLVLSGLAAYAGTWADPFIFDDRPAILENASIRHLWPLSIPLTPPGGGVTVSGRPLLNLSFALNYAASGENVWSYHALNLAIHLGAALVLYGIARRLLAETFPALAVALLWELHPLQTESVTCVAQRSESLMGLFYLLTVYCFVRSEVAVDLRATVSDSAQTTVARRSTATSWQVLSIAASLLGMATKETMVTAPLIVLLYDRTFLAGSFAEAWRRRRGYYLGLAATWLLLVYLVVREGGQRGAAASSALSVTPLAYLVTQGWAVAHYLRLAFWPHPLVLDYGTLLVGLNQAWPSVLLVGSLAAASGWVLIRPWGRAARPGPPVGLGGPGRPALPFGETLARSATRSAGSGSRKAFVLRPALGFAGAWFFGILAPSSSVVPLVAQTVAEHRMYLPLAAVIAVAVWGISEVGRPGPGRRLDPAGRAGPPYHRWKVAVLGLCALALGLVTLRRNRDYRSAESIWRVTAAQAPANPRAHNGLGLTLAAEGKYAEAIASYREALRLSPDYPDALSNLGLALRHEGDLAGAGAAFRHALQVNPNYAEVRVNYGDALLAAGDDAGAAVQFRRAIALSPDFAEAHYDLGIVLAAAGDLKGSVAEYEETLRLRPAYAEARYNLGNVLTSLHRTREAIEQYQRALRIEPGSASVENNLGIALDQAGRPGEAVGQFDRALQAEPDSAEFHYNLANARLLQGRPAAAAEEYEKALRLRPAMGSGDDMLCRIYVGLGRWDAAVRHGRAAVGLKPEDPEAHNDLAVALAGEGRLGEAETECEAALRLRPDLASARSNLDRIRRAEGKAPR